MLRKLLFALVLLLGGAGTRLGHAQNLPWQWVATQNGSNAQSVTNAAVDAAGNHYVVGTYTGTLTLGTVTHPARGNGDMYVAKYNAQGQLQWSRSGGGGGYEWNPAVAVDVAGNCYVAGAFFNGSATFNGVTLTGNANKYNGYVFKLDAQGAQQWCVLAGYDASLYGIGLAPNGDLYACGRLSRIVPLSNGQTLASQWDNDAFVLHVNPATGALLDGFSFGDSRVDRFNALTFDAAGNLYLAGGFAGTVAFGSTTLTSFARSMDAIAVKCTPQGQVQWVWRLGSDGEEEATNLAVDAAGQVTVVGNYVAEYPTTYGQGSLPVQPGDVRNGFAARLTAQGLAQWVRTVGGTGSDDNTGVILDAAGNCYISGGHGPQWTLDGIPGTPSGTGTTGHLLMYDPQGTLRYNSQLPNVLLSRVGRTTAGLWMAGQYRQGGQFPPLQVPAPVPTTAGSGFVGVLGYPALTTRTAVPATLGLAPNPAYDQVQVTLPQPAASGTTLMLYNALGQAVRTAPVAPQGRTAALDVRGLARGWYVVRWQSPQGVGTQGLLLE